VRAAHIDKERGTPTHITHKDSTPEQLPKWPHRGHYTVNTNSGKKCQHPREGNHIHGTKQDQPQGMKNRGKNNKLQVSLPNN